MKLQVPAFTVAVPSSRSRRRRPCTDDTPLVSLTVPDSASVLSLVSPPLEIVVVEPVSVPIVAADRLARRRGVDGRRHRRGGGGVAGIVGGLGGEAVAAVRQRRGGEAPGAGVHRRGTQQGRAVVDLHRRHPVGVAHRARQRQRVVLGQPAARDRRGRAGVGADRRADRLARRRGVDRRRHRRGGGDVAGIVGGLGGEDCGCRPSAPGW